MKYSICGCNVRIIQSSILLTFAKGIQSKETRRDTSEATTFLPRVRFLRSHPRLEPPCCSLPSRRMVELSGCDSPCERHLFPDTCCFDYFGEPPTPIYVHTSYAYMVMIAWLKYEVKQRIRTCELNIYASVMNPAQIQATAVLAEQKKKKKVMFSIRISSMLQIHQGDPHPDNIAGGRRRLSTLINFSRFSRPPLVPPLAS